jgi:hypothetical protein
MSVAFLQAEHNTQAPSVLAPDAIGSDNARAQFDPALNSLSTLLTTHIDRALTDARL